MNFRQFKSNFIAWRATQRGRNYLTFLIFVVIATAFWFLTALNEDEQRGFDVPIEITELPEDVTLLNNSPLAVNVIVRDKGRALIRFDWGKKPTLRLKFGDFVTTNDNRLIISQQTISNFMRNTFGQSSEILSVRPDSLAVPFTTRKPEILPIDVNVSALTAPQYIVCGEKILSTDTVKVYSQHGLPSKIKAISTKSVSLRNLTDTTTVEVMLEPPTGSLLVPSKILVTIPVQPLILKKQTINVTTANVPKGMKMLTFPSTVDVSYMVPMSMYQDDSKQLKAVADYRNVKPGNPSTVHIILANIPEFYQGVTCLTEEVEIHLEEANLNNETDKPADKNK